MRKDGRLGFCHFLSATQKVTKKVTTQSEFFGLTLRFEDLIPTSKNSAHCVDEPVHFARPYPDKQHWEYLLHSETLGVGHSIRFDFFGVRTAIFRFSPSISIRRYKSNSSYLFC
jgi:hypothetical protein